MFYKSSLRSEFSFSNKCMRAFWFLMNLFFFRFTAIQLNFLRIFLLKIFGAKIGKNVLIYPSVEIWAPWNLSIADRSVIGPKVLLYNVGKIEIAEDVTVSQRTHICTASHDIQSPSRDLLHSPVIINKGAWIFADAFLSMGVEIGEGAIVGARSVVTKDVASFEVVGGNPAKFIKRRKKIN